MFKINDYVMYGITGVCKILDIKEEKDRNSVIKKYYVLRPIYSKNTIIKTPVNNMKISMRKIHSLDEVNSLITAIAVSLILQNGARVLPFIGPNPRQYPTMKTVNFEFGILSISNIQIIVIVLSAVLMVLLNYIINYTKTGKAMRAVSYDMQAASLMGISVNKTIAFTFALGAVLAAAGGILYATAYPQIEPTMGTMPGLKAFVAAVLGGIGSVPGAMLGGYILGIAETMTKGFLLSQFADAISFSILIIILLVKPTGIMGEKVRVKV